MIAALAHALVVVFVAVATGVWPLQPRPEVVQRFSPASTVWGPGHRGVDLLGHPGEQVHATQAGTISFAGRIAGRGVVVVNHGSIRTTYEPVSARVHVGETVAVAAVIGTLDTFPSHCWPRTCLHWGLLRADTYLDPLTLVGSQPVRLLPLSATVPTSQRFRDIWWSVPTTPWGSRLGPGVSLSVGLTQPVGGDVGVDLGGGQ